ncbi:MAG: hypothetical protein LCH26_01630 [Proteobacteria bacterium]|nr:hypothetical protein [Pseudomonadota bacterium]
MKNSDFLKAAALSFFLLAQAFCSGEVGQVPDEEPLHFYRPPSSTEGLRFGSAQIALTPSRSYSTLRAQFGNLHSDEEYDAYVNALFDFLNEDNLLEGYCTNYTVLSGTTILDTTARLCSALTPHLNHEGQ